jgi:hypothetical protein
MQHNIVENLASLRYSVIKEGCAMKRLGIAEPEVMEIALKNEILRSEEARYDHRLHGYCLSAEDCPVMKWERSSGSIRQRSRDGCKNLKIMDLMPCKIL